MAGRRPRPGPDLRRLGLALCALVAIVGSAHANGSPESTQSFIDGSTARVDVRDHSRTRGDAEARAGEAAPGGDGRSGPPAPLSRPSEYEALFPPPLADGPDDPSDASFCVVVRTYWKHGLRRNQGLEMLLSSLRAQNVTSWEAIVVVMDGRPFYNLHQIVDQFDDPRIWVYSEWVGDEFSARDPQNPRQWAAGYHEALYSLTDDAVAACPRNSTWVVVTNGDNEVAKGFFWTIAERGRHADLVALDFFSRFQRPTARACERFGSRVGETERAVHVGSAYGEGGEAESSRGDEKEKEEKTETAERGAAEGAAGNGEVKGSDAAGRSRRSDRGGPDPHPPPRSSEPLAFPPAEAPAPLCKRNLAAWCNTDLGANAFRKARMDAERVRFGGPHGGLPDSGGEHADGLLAADLVTAGWRLERVSDGCFFAHSPNPQACAWAGGVWDDRFQAWGSDGVGGSCIKLAEAEELVRKSLQVEQEGKEGKDGKAKAAEDPGAGEGDGEGEGRRVGSGKGAGAETAGAVRGRKETEEQGRPAVPDGALPSDANATDENDADGEDGGDEDEKGPGGTGDEKEDQHDVDGKESAGEAAPGTPSAPERPLEPLELVEVEMSGWREGARYLGVSSPPPRTIMCLREVASDSERLWGDRMDTFGTDCADELDRPALLERSRRLGRPDPAWVHGANAGGGARDGATGVGKGGESDRRLARGGANDPADDRQPPHDEL